MDTGLRTGALGGREMTRISWYGYDLEVDGQATRDWYA